MKPIQVKSDPAEDQRVYTLYRVGAWKGWGELYVTPYPFNSHVSLSPAEGRRLRDALTAAIEAAEAVA